MFRSCFTDGILFDDQLSTEMMADVSTLPTDPELSDTSGTFDNSNTLHSAETFNTSEHTNSSDTSDTANPSESLDSSNTFDTSKHSDSSDTSNTSDTLNISEPSNTSEFENNHFHGRTYDERQTLLANPASPKKHNTSSTSEKFDPFKILDTSTNTLDTITPLISSTSPAFSTRNRKPLTLSRRPTLQASPVSSKKHINENKPPFVHEIDFKQAERLLLTMGIDGSFLVRTPSNDPHNYVLSFRKEDTVYHMKIEIVENMFTCAGLPRQEAFSSLEEFIMFCQTLMIDFTPPNGEKSFTLDLDYPLWPTDWAAVTTDRSIFFGRLGEQHAVEILKQHDESEGNCLVHSSVSKPGYFVITVRTEGTFEHLLAGQCENGLYLELRDGTRIIFPDMRTLIRHYSTTPIVILDRRDKKMMKTKDIYLIQPLVCPWNSIGTPIQLESSSPSNQLAQQFKLRKRHGKMQSDENRRQSGKSHRPSLRFTRLINILKSMFLYAKLVCC